MLQFADADGLSARGRATVGIERTKLLNYLYAQIIRDRVGRQATELYSNTLMMTSTLIVSFLLEIQRQAYVLAMFFYPWVVKFSS